MKRGQDYGGKLEESREEEDEEEEMLASLGAELRDSCAIKAMSPETVSNYYHARSPCLCGWIFLKPFLKETS